MAGPVVHVIAPAEAGGAESVLFSLATAAKASTVVAILNQLASDTSPPHSLTESLRRAGVTVREIRCGRRRYRSETKALASYMREVGAIVAHTHGYHADWVGYFAARRTGRPAVATAHGFTGGGAKNRLLERLDRWILGRFDAVIAVSRALADQLIAGGVAHGRVHVVPNAWRSGTLVDRAAARRELGLDQETFQLGWVGRISAEKGLDVFLHALTRITALPWSASIIGDGPERHRLMRRAEDAGLGPRLRWLGIIPEAARLFRAFDAFVLSSRTEGTPVVLFEAMAAGVPIVATGVGGVPDVVSEREAVLVAPEDPAALATALQSVLTDPDSARRRAEAAQRRLSGQFAVEPWVERHMAIYRAVNERTLRVGGGP
ncbi:MAG TPA: glycosyltransferase [Gemmatimonadales bacterium]|nr:glycosyltransferase [Gemmatimonadales bacterium]